MTHHLPQRRLPWRLQPSWGQGRVWLPPHHYSLPHCSLAVEVQPAPNNPTPLTQHSCWEPLSPNQQVYQCNSTVETWDGLQLQGTDTTLKTHQVDIWSELDGNPTGPLLSTARPQARHVSIISALLTRQIYMTCYAACTFLDFVLPLATAGAGAGASSSLDSSSDDSSTGCTYKR